MIRADMSSKERTKMSGPKVGQVRKQAVNKGRVIQYVQDKKQEDLADITGDGKGPRIHEENGTSTEETPIFLTRTH